MSATRDRPGPLAAELRNAAGVTIDILANGGIGAIRHGDVLINQAHGNAVEGSIGNLYLRRRRRNRVVSVPLLGPASSSRLRTSDEAATWEGSFEDVDYACTLRLSPRRPTWFWTVTLESRRRRGSVSLDAVLSQDLGIAEEAAVRANELYTSQYIDHTVVEDAELGILLCSRQNLPQNGAAPWIMHGCLNGSAGFLTDGVQFNGLEYKSTNVAAALGRRTLPNRTYQYELAMPTLQSRPVSLAPSGTAEITFFAAFVPDHPAATSDADARHARSARTEFGRLSRTPIDGPPWPRVPSSFGAPRMFASRDLEPADLDRFFGPERRHAENAEGGTLLSFFHGVQRHVVLKAKELLQERPTGHIMLSAPDRFPSDETMSVTAWMFGVFGSQLSIGNTSYNTLLSVVRNPLNVLKSSGQRIFVRTGEGWELLGMPSAFEMGLNGARWIYHGDRQTLSVRVQVAPDAPVYRLEVDVERGGPVALLVSHEVTLGAGSGQPTGRIAVDGESARVELHPAPETPMGRHYPEATFFIAAPDAAQVDAIGGDGLLHPDGVDRGGSFVVVRTKPVLRCSLLLTGSVLDAGRAAALVMAAGARLSDAASDRAIARFWSGVAGRASIGGGSGRFAVDLGRLDDALRWNVHDAMIHFTAPHGLEQHNGAAWGVRDVCQGPAELLVATGNLPALRAVLKTVYEHQFQGTGDWPQWFMFDRYREVQAAESHADVIHWPLKALCDYVEASGDLSILDERVAYTDERTKAVTDTTESIFTHTERQVDRIERSCIPGTALVAFGGGDWEDTLQPVDPAMAARMVSAWTVELAYQTLGRYRVVCERAGRREMAHRLEDLCRRMRADFNRHLVPDGVVSGLAHFDGDRIEYFLHSRDRRTGIRYRLLPMTRGMISGMFSPQQAARHVDLIRRHLSFPDGVRLMDRPMAYRGGPSRTFRRAESAANFGREVGLQYVHAHVRYVEAMARVGRADEAFEGLLAVCPIRLDLNVPNALPRQANAFFSSSDAAFLDRRQASRQFGRLRSGRIGVKGGWRIYSSGPGIYLNQLVSNVLGLRAAFDHVVFDPVLPRGADGLTFDTDRDGRRVRYRYRVANRGFSPDEVRVNGRRLDGTQGSDNPYRPSGMLVDKRAFLEALDRPENIVDILV